MILLHRLKGQEFWINHRHIEMIEQHHDTIITLTNEHRFIVQETPKEIAKKIQAFEAGAKANFEAGAKANFEAGAKANFETGAEANAAVNAENSQKTKKSSH